MEDSFLQNNKQKALEVFKAFEELIKNGEQYGIDLNDINAKLSSIKESLENNRIKVALIGGYSEGKTTLAAGWLGRLEENMNIDTEESSDSIQVYRPEGLEKDCEIIDTPGLYGFKSLQDGTKFKELTLKYVSEAHLILFVLNPDNPIKDSHEETVKWLFRDLNKIDSVIFVINKMDDVANLKDPDSFQEKFEIKKQNVIDALDRIIELSENERNSMTIVGVSANPQERGLKFWLERKEDYLQRSRINELRERTNNILANSKVSLVQNTNLSVIKDILIKQYDNTRPFINNLSETVESRKDIVDSLKNDFEIVQSKINGMMDPLSEELISYKNELVRKFIGSDETNFAIYVQEEIGKNAINFEIRLNNIFRRYVDEINGLQSSLNKSFENEINFAQNLLDKHNTLIKSGLTGLNRIPVTQWHSIINNSRNFLNTNFNTAIKFKPWGITKLAKNVTGALAIIGIAWEIIGTVRSIYKSNKFDKSKKEVIDSVSEIIDEHLKLLKDKKKFIQTFAPHLKDLEKRINEFSMEYEKILQYKLDLENWFNSVQNFSFKDFDIEDIDYEDID